MDSAWTLTFAAMVPFLCLGLLMWLAHLEDTLLEPAPAKATRAQAPTVQKKPTVVTPVTISADAPVRAAA